MHALDTGAGGIALAVEHDGRLVGVVTDGDLRRALLRGATLDSPVEPTLNQAFVAIHAGQAASTPRSDAGPPDRRRARPR
jgi:hypothetical protein